MKNVFYSLIFCANILMANDNINISEKYPVKTSESVAVIDFSESGLPELDIRRGYILRPAIDRLNITIMNQLKALPGMGMQLVALPKDLNQFDENWVTNPLGEYFLSYRSKGNTFLGGDGEKEEFSRNGEGGIDVRVNSKYLEYCRTARSLGLQLVVQCSGVPVEGKDDGKVEHLFPLDERRSFHREARYYPLPAAGSYEANGEVIFQWMRKLHDELGGGNTIFAGNQEPSHTAGYFNGGIQTDEATIQNVQVYPAIWRPIALKLQNAGMLSAVSQLNEVYPHYDPSIESIVAKGVPLDYYSIQNYRAQNNKTILAAAKAALEKYGLPTSKKVLFNRYDYVDYPGLTSYDQRFGTAPGMIAFLESELVLCDYADMVYGYCFFTGGQNYTMMNSVFTFLNAMPQPRKKILNIPTGLKYIVSADEKRISAVIWNPGTSECNFDLDASGANGIAELSVLKGSATELSLYNPVAWDPTIKKVSGLKLGSKEFILIKIHLLEGGTGFSADKNKEIPLKAYASQGKIIVVGVPFGDIIQLYNISGVLRKEIVSIGDKNEFSITEKGVFTIKTRHRSVKVIVV